MNTIKLDYYDKFKCIAGDCSDSCCVGWEIDIDEESLIRYLKEKGELGESLRANIKDGSFVLRKDESCPFLQKDGLCRLICQKGEDFLCEICREHPRYYEFYEDWCDVGLGLCCQEACRLLFENQTPPSLIYSSPNPPEEAKIRHRLIEEASYTHSLSFYDDYEGIFRLWSQLEPFDDRWNETTAHIVNNIEEINASKDRFLAHIGQRVYEYRHLRVYLLHRHFMKVYQGYENVAKGIEIYLTTQLLWDIHSFLQKGRFDFQDRIDTAKYLSKQLEYSQENTDILFG